ncbi:MAG TPA: VOC family protein [Rhizomicrobium sp.]|jgi:PhnB protein|nr:VOC family protein [Rhizomicrobium sp.]
MSDDRAPLSIYLIATPAAEALDFYVKGLGAKEIMRWVDPDNGKIGHSEFQLGGTTLYLADGYGMMEEIGVKSPAALGGTTLNLWLQVDDLDAALKRAVDAGARVTRPIEINPNEGGRRARIADPAGHAWTLTEK